MCAARKVVPLEDALQNKKVWITGVRREDSEARKNTPIVSRDIMRGVIKVNPLAGTSDSDIALYNELYELPVHPLREHGYTSIGCWPCTRPTKPGEDPRAGRWSGSGKTECGLHIS
jgi:phosphoadenosine phosphosulfate reductase